MLNYEERMELMTFFVCAIVQNKKGFLKEKMVEAFKQGASPQDVSNMALAAQMYIEKRFKNEPIILGKIGDFE